MNELNWKTNSSEKGLFLFYRPLFWGLNEGSCVIESKHEAFARGPRVTVTV